jgi:hypothetical protein
VQRDIRIPQTEELVLCQKKDALQNENGFDSNIKMED